jgi:uncharacterized protein
MSKTRSLLYCAVSLLARVLPFLFVGFSASPALAAGSPNIVISQVYGGGGNSGATLKNDFIEIFNRDGSTINLSGWSVQYASTTGSSWQVTALPSRSLAPGQYLLIQEAAGTGGTTNLPTPDAIGSIPMSATGGKVALVNTTTALSGSTPPTTNIVDLVGYDGATFFEGAGAAPTLSNTTAALRLGNGCTDTDNNNQDFVSGSPAPRNTVSPFNACGVSTSPAGVGAANPNPVPAGNTVLLTVAVTPGTNPSSTGLSVTADLSSIGGASSQAFFDDGSNGDPAGNDNTFSFSYSVPISTVAGSKSLSFIVRDAEGRQSTGAIALTIDPPPPAEIAIHDIQGSGTTSPYAGRIVSTRGIVTALRFNNGFFIQTPDNQVDADPNTSEGIFVFTSSAPPAAAALGNLVRVVGTVQEFVPASDPSSPPSTEITSPTVTLLSTGNSLPEPVTIAAADTSPAGSIEQLEKYEHMRVHVDSLTVIAPTQGTTNEPNATGSSNGIFYGVITGVARPFREPGIEVPDPLPAGSPTNVPRFDANPERLRVDADGQVGSVRTQIAPGVFVTNLEVTSGAVVSNLTGVLDYSSRTYTILPDSVSPPTLMGNISAIPVPAPAADELTIASFNMERFFDTVNDPGVDDVALTATAFANRLNKASLTIRNVMNSPDIIGVEEMENLTTLQAVANKVNADSVAAGKPNPNYTAYLVEGNDIGGIDVGFLIKDRVTVVDVKQVGKDTTYTNPLNGQQELLNDRPSLVLRATAHQPGADPFPFTVIVNHLRSLSGVDDPVDGARVRAKRRAQAEFLTTVINDHKTENLVLVGDFNAFGFNDGYVDVIGTIKGVPTPADQVVLASDDLVDPDLADLADLIPADQRYSFSFDGNAQELDHVLVNPAMMTQFSRFAIARNDADFPESYRTDANRPERISDHDPAVAYFHLPAENTPPVLTLPGDITVEASGPAGANVSYMVSATDNVDGDVPVSCEPPSGSTFALGTTIVNCSASDAHGNVAHGSFAVNVVDTIAPVISCGGPDGLWHASDVSITCHASDNGSGLAITADATFTLSTSVAAGIETANASTNSHTVCDHSGNCSTAGPIAGNKVDKRGPQISIASPANATYLLNQVVASNYNCSDAGSGLSTCSGPVASGANINTTSVGAQNFTVNSTDAVGNTSSSSVTYTVAYNVCLLYDTSHSRKAGSTVPIRLQLCDGDGNNVSSAAVQVTAVRVVMVSTGASLIVDDSGSANPDGNFRFEDGSYIFNLSTKGLATGTYNLVFVSGNDATTHSAPFQIR